MNKRPQIVDGRTAKMLDKLFQFGTEWKKHVKRNCYVCLHEIKYDESHYFHYGNICNDCSHAVAVSLSNKIKNERRIARFRFTYTEY